jgi:hypothetical protein
VEGVSYLPFSASYLATDMGGDAAAVVDLQALVRGTVAYLLVLVVCGGPADAGRSAGGPGDLAGRLDVALQLPPQLVGVLAVQVDLITSAVQVE